MNREFLARHWDEIDRLLDAVLDMTETERAAHLARECAGRPELRRAVESVLQADRGSDRFLAGGYAIAPEEPDAAPAAPEACPPGTTVGPYRLQRLLGEGGMGTVYLAQRADGQFDQQLAIKILHGGVSGSRGNERFFRERQILAGFDHLNIARLLDGGVTEDGRPYFAMEFIDGDAVDVHCDRRRLPLRQRLELFLQICDAVQYAHGRLIVHRDLKPGNILVDRQGTAKLLDFGIATPLTDGENDVTRSQMVMTPAYAAPEQFRGEPATAATDVYALGLVLYELLTGHRAHRVESPSPLQLQRAVLETDPDRPSRIVTTEDADGTTSPARIAEARRTAPTALSRRLAGDLDAIVMKALRKEPGARYASVEAMRRDVEAHLDSRPVDARRGTAAYRFRKAVRRHRVEAISAAVVLVALTGGVVVASTQARLAAVDRDRARTAQAREAAVNDFLLHELLRSPSPEYARGEDVSVMEVLDSASRNVAHALREQPRVEASVRQTLAQTYASLGKLDEAIAHARAARDRIASSDDPDGSDLFDTRRLLARLALERGEYDACERDLESLLDDQRRALGDDDPGTIRTSILRARLDQVFGRDDAARSRLERDIARLEARHPRHWRTIAEAKTLLAHSMTEQRDVVAAEALLRETLALQRDRLGSDHPDVGVTLGRLGAALQRQLRYHEAREAYEELVELRRRTHGPRHPLTGDAILLVAVTSDRMNRYEEAERLAREAHAIFLESLGSDHPRTVRAVSNVAILYMQQGRFEEAIPYYRQTIAAQQEIYGEHHLRSIGTMADFANVLHASGRVEEARTWARRVLGHLEGFAAQPDVDSEVLRRFAWYLLEVIPEDLRDPQRALTLAQQAVEATGGRRLDELRILARTLRATGDLTGAIDTLYRAWETDEAKDSWSMERQLRDYLVAAGRFDEAETFLLENLERRHRQRGDRDSITALTLVHLAEFYRDRDRPAEAEERYRQAVEQYGRALDANDWRIARASGGVGAALVAQQKYEEAEPLLLAAYDTLEADNGVRRTHIDHVQAALVRLYEETGRPADADRWRRREPRNYHPDS